MATQSETGKKEYWEYNRQTKHYRSFNANNQFIKAYSREEFYDYLKSDVATFFYGKTVMEPRKLVPDDSKYQYYRIKNKELNVVVLLSEQDVEEIQELEYIKKEINSRSSVLLFSNTRKLKTWVKVGIGIALGASGVSVMHLNSGPEFDIPYPAEQVYEEINTQIRKDGKDIYNINDRLDAASELYQFVDKEELNHRYELDNVGVSIKMVEKEYDDNRITETVAKEKLEEIDQNYKQMMTEYEQQQSQTRTK